MTAPTRSALFYDASYDSRNNRVTITEDPCEIQALCETLSSATTKSALIYDANYDPRAGKASFADEDNNLVGAWPDFNEVPILTWSPPSSRSSSCSLPSLDTISTAPTSPGTPDRICRDVGPHPLRHAAKKVRILDDSRVECGTIHIQAVAEASRPLGT